MGLVKDTTKRDLGNKMHQCIICDAKGEFQTWLVREMLYGTRKEFEYFECPECKCLQISEIPKNLGDYYGEWYYSFHSNTDEEYECNGKEKKGRILDVGCGDGKWLFEKAREGYRDLWGCDPFTDEDKNYGDVIKIKKSFIHDMSEYGEFDLIHMGDSLEHVTDPVETMISARGLLRSDGRIEVSIPTWPNYAFDLFKTHWFQIDAPRHVFLPSVECMKILASKAGLEVESIEYDSNENQFLVSFFYEHNIPLIELSDKRVLEYFNVDQIFEVKKMVLIANHEKRGDHMKVTLKHKMHVDD